MTIHLPAETAMALAMAMTDARYSLHEKRSAAEQAVEDLIAFLDQVDGDPDLEPWLGYGDDREGGDIDDCEGDELDAGPGMMWRGESDGDCDAEPSLGAPETRTTPLDYFYAQRTMIVQTGPADSQEHWAEGNRDDLEENVEDEGEATNEDGGDILDEPHDELAEGNDEYSLDGVQPDGPSGWTPHQNYRAAAAPLLKRVWSLRVVQ